MLDDLIIVNFPPDSIESISGVLTRLQWRTCLRRIVFLHQSDFPFLQSRSDVYRGQAAYRFLLEVICGLHSPMIGETAVMGQFRTFRAGARFPATAWGRFLSRLTTDLLVDARYIRQHYLQGLGSQSYGSLIRKHLEGTRKVVVLGTGSLAREILRWLIGKMDVRLFYRSLLHAQRLKDQYAQIQLNHFMMADAGWGNGTLPLIIAAPISSIEINAWLKAQNVSFSPTLDLRGEAEADPLHTSLPVIKLAELWDSLRCERKKLEPRVAAARTQIAEKSHLRQLVDASDPFYKKIA